MGCVINSLVNISVRLDVNQNHIKSNWFNQTQNRYICGVLMNTTTHNRYDHLVFWGTCLGYGLFLLYILSSFTSFKVFHNRYTNKKVAATIYAPKWELYKASPLESVNRIYTLQGNKATEIDLRPFTPHYLFGLNRTSKIIAQEITVITKDSSFMKAARQYTLITAHDTTPDKYLNTATLQYTTVARHDVLYLRGKYIITIERPRTWQQNRDKTATTDTLALIPVNILPR